MEQTHDTNISAFMSSAADLLQSTFDQALDANGEDKRYLARAIQAGALISLRATFGPTTGLAQLAVELIEPNGNTHNIMSAELGKI